MITCIFVYNENKVRPACILYYNCTTEFPRISTGSINLWKCK